MRVVDLSSGNREVVGSNPHDAQSLKYLLLPKFRRCQIDSHKTPGARLSIIGINFSDTGDNPTNWDQLFRYW